MVRPPVCDFGWSAPDFLLPGTDGKEYALRDVAGPKGTLIMFICNHCPFVLAILDRIRRDADDLQKIGIGVAAICSNDALRYPQDSFDNMARLAGQAGFTFPYLHDDSQEVARAYDAQCTPDFMGSTARWGCNIVGAWMLQGYRPGLQICRGICLTRCAALPRLAKVRPSKFRRWAVR